MTQLKFSLHSQSLIQQELKDHRSSKLVKDQFNLLCKVIDWNNIRDHIESGSVDDLYSSFDDALETILESELQRTLSRVLVALIIKSPLIKSLCREEKDLLTALGYTE